jgi:hypothetical protein
MAKITSGFPFVLLQERPANLQPCQLEPHCCDSALPAPAAVVTSEQCKERGADAWIGEYTAALAALRSIQLCWSVTGFSPPCTGSVAVGTLPSRRRCSSL